MKAPVTRLSTPQERFTNRPVNPSPPFLRQNGVVAGPGRPGPARKGGEEVEYLKLKGRVLSLYAQGRTHADIASTTGLERSAVTKMIPRVKREVLTDNERTLEALFLQSQDLEELGQQLLQRIASDESGPSHRDIKAMVEILRAKRRLFPTDLLWPPGTNLPLLSENVELTGDTELSQSPAEMSHQTGWIWEDVDDAGPSGRGEGVTAGIGSMTVSTVR